MKDYKPLTQEEKQTQLLMYLKLLNLDGMKATFDMHDGCRFTGTVTSTQSLVTNFAYTDEDGVERIQKLLTPNGFELNSSQFIPFHSIKKITPLA